MFAAIARAEDGSEIAAFSDEEEGEGPGVVSTEIVGALSEISQSRKITIGRNWSGFILFKKNPIIHPFHVSRLRKDSQH